MDFLILAICLGIIAVALGISIYFVMIKIFESERIQTFVFALLMLIICEVMVLFLIVFCIFKLAGLF